MLAVLAPIETEELVPFDARDRGLHGLRRHDLEHELPFKRLILGQSAYAGRDNIRPPARLDV